MDEYDHHQSSFYELMSGRVPAPRPHVSTTKYHPKSTQSRDSLQCSKYVNSLPIRPDTTLPTLTQAQAYEPVNFPKADRVVMLPDQHPPASRTNVSQPNLQTTNDPTSSSETIFTNSYELRERRAAQEHYNFW